MPFLSFTSPAIKMGFIAPVYIVTIFDLLNTEILGKQPQQISNFPARNKGKASRREEKQNEDIESSQKNLSLVICVHCNRLGK